MARIDYYFATISPYTYLAGTRMEEVAAKHGATITYKPVDLITLFGRTGGIPPKDRHPSRQEMRLQELRRSGVKNDMPINLKPAFWPTNPAPSAYAIIAAQKTGEGDLGALVQGLFRNAGRGRGICLEPGRGRERGRVWRAVLRCWRREVLGAGPDRRSGHASRREAIGASQSYHDGGQVLPTLHTCSKSTPTTTRRTHPHQHQSCTTSRPAWRRASHRLGHPAIGRTARSSTSHPRR